MKRVFAILAVAVFCLAAVSAAHLANAAPACGEGERRVCGSDIGICKSGRSICKEGNWTECDGAVKPKEIDICGNSLDDNCDGAVDENCFPWVTLVIVGMAMFFVGVGLYYMERDKGGRIESEGVSKD
jgi:hypothetical protein